MARINDARQVAGMRWRVTAGVVRFAGLAMASLTAVACGGGPTLRGSDVGMVGSDGRYHLSAKEKTLDCRRLRGRMHIRILQVKSKRKRLRSSATSQLMHQSMTPIYGGSTYGADPERDLQHDLAQIKAYNRRLGELKCEPLDIKGALAEPVQNG